MAEISYSADQLVIEEVTVDLRYPIKDVTTLGEVVVALLDVPSETIDNRNVEAFDRDGNRLWTIQASVEERDNPYMSIEEGEEGLIVEAWNGMRYRVDEDTGEISDGSIRRF